MDGLVIETHDLTKRYGSFVAMESLNLAVKHGEVYGVLGPNGSGKTTTILMLLGLTEPTSGTVRVLGFDPVRQPLSVKAKVGYLPDQVGFYDELTARENLIYIAKLNGLSRDEGYRRIDEALERVDLSHAARQRVGTFSHGMRQRLGLAEVLIKQPRLIIMDEPAQGLDPAGAREFLEIIRSLKQTGISILLSSHLLHQVQQVCDRVALFRRGRMMIEGSVQELAQRVLGGAYRIRVGVEGPAEPLQQALQRLPDVVAVTRPRDSQFELNARRDLRAEAARAVIEAGGALQALEVEQPSLDDIYAQYFKEVEHVAAA